MCQPPIPPIPPTPPLLSQVSGAKFYYLKNEAVLLEMALISWSLSCLLARGFSPLSTPDLVRSQVLEKCGFQPRAANTQVHRIWTTNASCQLALSSLPPRPPCCQVYSIEGMDLCLAGTAEILVGGMHMDRILSAAQLPLKLVAFSHCFRTEAGAAGAATRSALALKRIGYATEATRSESGDVEETLPPSVLAGACTACISLANLRFSGSAPRRRAMACWRS